MYVNKPRNYKSYWNLLKSIIPWTKCILNGVAFSFCCNKNVTVDKSNWVLRTYALVAVMSFFWQLTSPAGKECTQSHNPDNYSNQFTKKYNKLTHCFISLFILSKILNSILYSIPRSPANTMGLRIVLLLIKRKQQHDGWLGIDVK